MSKKSTTPFIDQFGEDLTKMAADGKLDPIIGREKEVYRICQILSRRKKNNPIILGDPGVGKTALIEAIAQRIVDKKVAMTLLNKRIVSLNISNIVAGTKYRGEFEERMKNIVDELKENRDVIVFIDEIHTIVGAGGVSGSLDASNILKPALARGQVQCIGATTLDEYRENIEKDGALTRRFQEIFIDPPSQEDAIEILNRIKPNYEDYHAVSYTDEAIEACVVLSDRYITQRELPDKAIDVMDEAGAKVHLQEVKMPEVIKELEVEADKLKTQKLLAVEQQDYEKAGKFRDLELAKKDEIENLDLFEDIKSIKESFAYLFVGHWMQGELGEDRKNVGLLVKAFFETFKKVRSVKNSMPERPSNRLFAKLSSRNAHGPSLSRSTKVDISSIISAFWLRFDLPPKASRSVHQTLQLWHLPRVARAAGQNQLGVRPR